MTGRSIFAESYNAEASFTSDYFKDGTGTAVILENLQKTKDGEEKFIARMKIVAVTPKSGLPANVIGEQVGWIQMVSKFPKVAKPNIQKYIMAIVNGNKDTIAIEDFVATCEDCVNYQPGAISEYNGRKIEVVQAARGMLIKFDTYRQATNKQKVANAANPTKPPETSVFVNWSHVDEAHGNDEASIAKRRAELDATDPIKG